MSTELELSMFTCKDALLVSALLLIGTYPFAEESRAKPVAQEFIVPLAGLTSEVGLLYYRGQLLDANNPSVKFQDGQEAEATGATYPNAMSCLEFDANEKDVSLTKLKIGQFDKIADLEVCLQRVGNELGDLFEFPAWLQAMGFGEAGERPMSYWLSANRLGLNSDDVAVFHAQWRGGDSFVGRPFPLSRSYRWSDGFGAKNLVVTMVVRRSDLQVISVKANLIFL